MRFVLPLLFQAASPPTLSLPPHHHHRIDCTASETTSSQPSPAQLSGLQRRHRHQPTAINGRLATGRQPTGAVGAQEAGAPGTLTLRETPRSEWTRCPSDRRQTPGDPRVECRCISADECDPAGSGRPFHGRIMACSHRKLIN